MAKLLTLCILLIGFSMTLCDTTQHERQMFEEFQNFLTTFNKRYSTVEEFEKRYEIFSENYEKATMHKQMFELHGQEQTYEVGINQFMDMTQEEFASTYLTLKITDKDLQKSKNAKNVLKVTYANGEAPESWDWREKGVVSRVKDQKACGSCWAFSAIGNIESMYAMKTNKSQEFSEQQLVDCDTVDKGCNGGLMEDAFKYLENSGVETETDYVYTAQNGNCKFDGSKIQAKVTGYHYAGTEDEEQIKQLLFENGPFAIALNAGTLQFYSRGIYDPFLFCSPKSINHGVLLVGYGVDGKGKKYWIVKNSWGEKWGENGYFRIIRGKGKCGVNTYVITAEVSDI